MVYSGGAATGGVAASCKEKDREHKSDRKSSLLFRILLFSIGILAVFIIFLIII
jgi:hypothetical protein